MKSTIVILLCLLGFLIGVSLRSNKIKAITEINDLNSYLDQRLAERRDG